MMEHSPTGVTGEKWPDCKPPPLRQMRKEGYRRADWTCPDCGQQWEYTDTWAGDGWYWR